MSCKVCRTLDIEPFINAIQRVLFRKRCSINQVIICTGNCHAFLLHIVQPHETVVVFRVTLCDLINTELLLTALQQRFFSALLQFQVCRCDLEHITSALDFCAFRNDCWPQTCADQVDLLSLIVQLQGLFSGDGRKWELRICKIIFQIAFLLFQQNTLPYICSDAKNTVMLCDLLLAGKLACRTIRKQRIDFFASPMPFQRSVFHQRQHIILPITIVVHLRKANHSIRQIFDFLLCLVHQAVDFFFVILGQCSRQTIHQFFRCCPVIQLESKIRDEVSLLIIENRFFLLLVGNQLFRILHRGHALCAPFRDCRFQLFQKVGCGQSNRIHRIFQFLHLLAAGPTCYIRK